VPCNPVAEMRSWESPLGEPAWILERELKGFFLICPTRHRCAKAKRTPDLEVPAWMKRTK